MSYKIEDLKENIKVHLIQTSKFKTNLIAAFFSLPIDKENVTKNALIPAVLKRGSKSLKTQEEINIELENMYGANLDAGIDKIGDNQIIKFYIETVNDNFLPKKENLLKKSINLLLDIIFNPFVEDDKFKEQYVETEKQTIRRLIEGKIDNKDSYAFNRCIEEMYKDKAFGIYKYGYIEDLEKINAKELYEHYKNLINSSKIDIFISGDFESNYILNIFNQNKNLQGLEGREDCHIINNEETEKKEKIEDAITLSESMNINQGKLVMGIDIDYNKPDSKYAMCLYNVILGESATSKLFQNVREKASLAYTARSNYVRQKNNIFIRCGIEIENYDEAVKIIKEQLEEMKNGEFTEEDIENSKKYMISGIKTVADEQDSEMTYYFGQELSGKLTNFEEYIDKINAVTKEQIQEIANSISINTIYFLRN
jgi:predicted Zn-dependent peptidase